jgi:hypothetical protein
MLIFTGVTSLACLIYLQISFRDQVYGSRFDVVVRGMTDIYPCFVLICCPAVSAWGIANSMRDRAWVYFAPRANTRQLLAQALRSAFTGAFAMCSVSAGVVIIGSLLTSLEPNIMWGSHAGLLGAQDLSFEAERRWISTEGFSGILSPIAGTSLILFYAVYALWMGLWGGLLSLMASAISTIVPWPLLALVSPLVWFELGSIILGAVRLWGGGFDFDLVMFPMVAGWQPVVFPILAGLFYLLPLAAALLWIWRRFDRLSGCQ